MTSPAQKEERRAVRAREARLRRAAQRRQPGMKLAKSHLRDPLAVGYGMWTVTRGRRRISPPGGWTIDEVERWLADPSSR